MEKKWIKEIDIIRAFSIILIVFSHLHYFINAGNLQNIFLTFSGYLALIGLSLFFFISGFGLYYNYPSINKLNELKDFYQKRLSRIYPLYIFAILLFVIWSIYYYQYITIDGTAVGYNSVLICLLGLQGIFFTNNTGILFWFIGVILLYYFIYPLLIRKKSIISIMSIAFVILSLLYLVHLNLNIIHEHFFYYYGTFIFGIVMCGVVYYNTYSKVSLNELLLLIFIFTSFLVLILYFKSTYRLIPIAICLITYILVKSLNFDKIYNIITKISVSSYPVFLLHFTILSIFSAIFLKLNLNYYTPTLILLSLPFIFCICYYIQIFDSKLIKNFHLISLISRILGILKDSSKAK